MTAHDVTFLGVELCSYLNCDSVSIFWTGEGDNSVRSHTSVVNDTNKLVVKIGTRYLPHLEND